MSGPVAAVVDYGAGNLRSICRALEVVGAQPAVIREPADARFDVLILPGVGAFGAAMRRLEEAGFPRWIRARVRGGTPLVGVCLGMQLLYERSEESPGVEGLGLLGGVVARLPEGRKIPHMGWNTLRIVRPSPLVDGVGGTMYAYFVHSYVVQPDDEAGTVAVTDYGVEFPAIVARGGVVGLQFHPEKSGALGLRLLSNTPAGRPIGAPR